MRFFLALILIAAGWAAFAQPETLDRSTAEDAIDEQAFLAWVIAHHPLAKRAALLNDEAAAYLQKARGAFDPKLSAGTYRKLFGDETYYDMPAFGVDIPTRLGIQPFAEFLNPAGTQLNPERKVPADGQIAAGIRIPLGKNLLTDAARTELAKARAYATANEAERALQLNQLMLDAAEAYWKWWKAAATVDLTLEALALSQWRADQIRNAFTLGDQAAIDTLEAGLLAQQRAAEQLQAEADLAYARNNALRFLWREDGLPAAPNANLRPIDPESSQLETTAALLLMDAVQWRAVDHPMFQAGSAKLDMAAADVRFRRDQLKPQIDLSVATLTGTDGPGDWDLSRESLSSNHLIGAKVSVPLLLRKERGNLNLAQIDQERQRFELQDKLAKLEASVNGLRDGLPALLASSNLAAEVAVGTRALLDAETTRLSFGESSLFKVNYRENQWIKSRKEAIERRAEWAMGVRALGFAMGGGNQGD